MRLPVSLTSKLANAAGVIFASEGISDAGTAYRRGSQLQTMSVPPSTAADAMSLASALACRANTIRATASASGAMYTSRPTSQVT